MVAELLSVCTVLFVAAVSGREAPLSDLRVDPPLDPALVRFRGALEVSGPALLELRL